MMQLFFTNAFAGVSEFYENSPYSDILFDESRALNVNYTHTFDMFR